MSKRVYNIKYIKMRSRKFVFRHNTPLNKYNKNKEECNNLNGDSINSFCELLCSLHPRARAGKHSLDVCLYVIWKIAELLNENTNK